MSFKVYLRSHAPNEVGRIDPDNRTNTSDARVAVEAYRALLARQDLDGEPWAAVLSVPREMTTGGGRSLYFSKFDKPIGMGRIHPDAPIDVLADPQRAEKIAQWRPSSTANNWEQDRRPLSECLNAWQTSHSWSRREAAGELRISRSLYNELCDGERSKMEGCLRRLMTLIDQQA